MNYSESSVIRSIKLTAERTIEIEREWQVLRDNEVRHSSVVTQTIDKSMNLHEMALEPLVIAFAGIAWTREDIAEAHASTLAVIQEEFDRKDAIAKDKHATFAEARTAEIAEHDELTQRLKNSMDAHGSQLAWHEQQEEVVKTRASQLDVHVKAFELRRESLRKEAVTLQALGADLSIAAAELAKRQPVRAAKP